MPNRPSLVRRLAELRSSYTGETDSSVLPALSHGLQLLTTEERSLLLGVLAQDNSMRLLGENAVPPVPVAVRQAVLPDATTTHQRALEAGVLLAASRAVDHLRVHPAPEPEQATRVLRMTRPQADELVLHLKLPALGPLLLELLPRQRGNTVLGMVGLRVHLHRRHLQLFLADHPDTRVLLANTSYRQWSAALAFMETVAGPTFAELWHGTDSGASPLTVVEHEALCLRGRLSDLVPAPLASSLLRRGLLLVGAPWLKVSSTTSETVVVTWQAGPSPATVATKLIHPILGLPGDVFQVLRVSAEQVNISTYDGVEESGLTNNTPTTVVLRRVTELHVDSQRNGCRSDQVNVERGWKRWNEAFRTPNPVHVGTSNTTSMEDRGSLEGT